MNNQTDRIQNAINHIKTATDVDPWAVEIAVEAMDMAIEALKAQELKNVPDTNVSNCPYCHEDSDGYVKPIEKNSHAFVRFGMDGWELSLKANGWHGEARIKFCPMCGRGLKH